jgi:hypothetical protein
MGERVPLHSSTGVLIGIISIKVKIGMLQEYNTTDGRNRND